MDMIPVTTFKTIMQENVIRTVKNWKRVTLQKNVEAKMDCSNVVSGISDQVATLTQIGYPGAMTKYYFPLRVNLTSISSVFSSIFCIKKSKNMWQKLIKIVKLLDIFRYKLL